MPRTRRSLAVGAVAAVVLAGCALGERPVLGPPGDTVPTAPTGNDQLDTVLGLLDSADGATFTASYELRTLFGSLDSTALVSRGDDLGTSITIENADRRIRFLADAEGERTCDLVAGTCEDGFDDARISDTQLPHDFWGRAFASRLRADANRRIADPVLYEDDVAGQAASCVDVDVSGGSKTYCALGAGPLARFLGPDVEIELVAWSPEPDPSAFEG